MIFSQLFDSLLLPGIIVGSDYILHPPFIAGSRAEHTAHQMIISVRMCKGMEGIELIHSEFLR